MEPRCVIRNDKGELVDYGEIKGSKPTVAYYRTKPEEQDNGLRSRDIKGNQPGSAIAGAFHERTRR